jgi:hypothetical protein
MQTVTTALLEFGEERRYRIPMAIKEDFAEAAAVAETTHAIIIKCLENESFDLDIVKLRDERNKMLAFYNELEPQLGPVELNDKIYKLIKETEEMHEALAGCLGGQDKWRWIPYMLSPPPGQSVAALNSEDSIHGKLAILFAESGQTLDDWVHSVDLEPTELYKGYATMSSLHRFHEVRYEIWKILAQRRMELHNVHNSKIKGMRHRLLGSDLRNQTIRKNNQHHPQSNESHSASGEGIQ